MTKHREPKRNQDLSIRQAKRIDRARYASIVVAALSIVLLFLDTELIITGNNYFILKVIDILCIVVVCISILMYGYLDRILHRKH